MGWRRQKVSVVLNDRFVGEFLCEHDPSFHVYCLPVPVSCLKVGKNRLVFRMAYRESLGKDPRELALAVDAIELKSLK